MWLTLLMTLFALSPGDDALMFWKYDSVPVRCTVALKTEYHRGNHRLELRWPDGEGGTAWTAVGPGVLAVRLTRGK